MPLAVPASWQDVLAPQTREPYFAELEGFLAAERAAHQVFPPEDEVFAALAATAYPDVRVVLIGQDPYHDDGQAHGMCFSVRPGVKAPPSLRNMYKELREDLGCEPPAHGYLGAWAAQGVLLLNTVLTVRAHEAASHKGRGWERFTDAVIRAVDEREQPAVFVLWGAHAKKKAALIDPTRHRVISGAHPSPLSARLFFGSRPFSKTNAALEELGYPPIDWQLPAIPAAV
ncbi:MAG TPA: uracil-DNA glycosylase [Gemmatimonadales bacterium]|nr:uracil-DNA glycosylase [Gemmatimonadales bacterium]